MKNTLKKLETNSSRVYLEQFVRAAAASLPAGSRVLDAGAGDCPYRDFFTHCEYESADFCAVEGEPYGSITYVCDLSSIPVEDGRYDLVLCTQVLEHLPEPQPVLNELYRVLKPGGSLYLSAPLFYAEHQIPYDFYRYTRYGLEYLLKKAGFQVKGLEPLEGYFGTLSYQLRSAAGGLPLKPRAYGGGLPGLIGGAAALVLKPLFYLLYLLYARLDVQSKYTEAGTWKNYTALACKPLE